MNTREKLRIIKKASGLTQENLAREMGVSFATFNSWINGRSTPHLKKLQRIDDVYAKYTGTAIIPETELLAKKELLKQRSKQYKNIVRQINKRSDVYNSLVLSLTYNSNGIEGSTFTEDETGNVLFHNASIPNKSLIEHLEAKNHQTALKQLFQCVTQTFFIDESFILKLHETLMNSIRDDAGRYRMHGVRIVGANVPTANYISIPNKMETLIKDLNTQTNDIIKHVSGIHSRFEQIHPFSDGNGRIGRLLIHAMLMKENFSPAIIEQEKKNLYYTYLRKAQVEHDTSLLEDFMCDSISLGFDMFEEIQ